MLKYDALNIKVYEGLEAVRKRPGMYIGNTDDGSGLHRLVFEIVDNSIDESLAGYCDAIKIILNKGNYVSIIDNGRGMPVDMHLEEKKSAAEVIMTILHSGGKFDENSYNISGGLHGVGVSVVNALSYKLRLRIFRNGFIYEQFYLKGKPLSRLKIINHTDKKGTEITFIPDNKIFLIENFSYNILLFRLKELSLLNPSVKFDLIDQRRKKVKYNFLFNEGGLKKFIEILNKDKQVIHEDSLYFFFRFDFMTFKVAFQWVDSAREHVLCYTNNVYQKNGGTHFIGFKAALNRAIKYYIEHTNFYNANYAINSDDIKNGLVAIISLYMKNPKFSSQIKDKLISAEVKNVIENILYSKLKDFFYENPNVIKLILNRITLSAKAREAVKKAKELSLKQTFDSNFFTKLSDCQETNPSLSELFLVEGDSAGGSAKQGRDRKNQAILPLKGKILNVEKADFEKIISNSEVLSLVTVLNCGIGKDNYNEDKLRYHKIILMTDADVDGAHIRTLLITFFYRYLPQLIKNKHIYIAKPPLYKFSKNINDYFYINDKNHLNDFLLDMINKILVKFCDKNELILNLINNFKNLFLLMDSKHSIPLFFFEKLIYFEETIQNLNLNDSFFLIEEKLNYFFLKDKVFSFLYYDIEKKNFLFSMNSNENIYSFSISLDFFLSKEYDVIKIFYKDLLAFFSYVRSLKVNNKDFYIYDFFSFLRILIKKSISEYSVQRYKGLGEMNPSQLWDTTMNPKTRNLHLLEIKDIDETDNIFSDLMGDNIDNRRKFIYKNSHIFLDLDF